MNTYVYSSYGWNDPPNNWIRGCSCYRSCNNCHFSFRRPCSYLFQINVETRFVNKYTVLGKVYICHVPFLYSSQSPVKYLLLFLVSGWKLSFFYDKVVILLHELMNFRFFFFTSRSGIFFVSSPTAPLITACEFSSKNYSSVAGARPITMWRPILVIDFLVKNKSIRVFIILVLPVTNNTLFCVFLKYCCLTSVFAVHARNHSFWSQAIIILLKRQETCFIKAS